MKILKCDAETFKERFYQVYPEVKAYPGSSIRAFDKVGFDIQDIYYQMGAVKYCIKDIRGDIGKLIPVVRGIDRPDSEQGFIDTKHLFKADVVGREVNDIAMWYYNNQTEENIAFLLNFFI